MVRCAPVTTRQPTKGTEIAALEARYNERQILAEGAVIGERRAALARLAMIAMFGFVTSLSGTRENVRVAVGSLYLLYAVTTFLALRRIKGGDPQKSFWRPLVLTVIDFAMITTMAILNTRNASFGPGQQVVATAIVMSFAVARISLVHVVASVAFALASYTISSIYAGQFASHVTVFVMGGYLVLGFMIGLTNRAVSRMFQGLRQRDNLTRFLPRQVAERVLALGPSALAPIEREITVMFSDIRGFTGMSEGMPPSEVLSMLDDYFGRMAQIVKGHDGVVGKFIGDGLLAYWGVPDRLDDHAIRAVRAARDMRRTVRELNQHRHNEGLAPLRIGIGIHTGNVAAGMLGGTLQSEYTVIGDAVNVASRVEGLTKQHEVDVLVSETTWAQLPEPRRGERIASAEIRGRKEPVVLYTIDSSAATLQVSAKPGV